MINPSMAMTMTTKRFLAAVLAVALAAPAGVQPVDGFSIRAAVGGRAVANRRPSSRCGTGTNEWSYNPSVAGSTTKRRSLLQSRLKNSLNSGDSHGSTSPPSSSSSSLNEWHAQLCRAVTTQDFLRAADLSKQMTERLGVSTMSWKGQGVAPWLVDRLSTLSYGIPTTIQVCSLEAVNRALIPENANGADSRNNSKATKTTTTTTTSWDEDRSLLSSQNDGSPPPANKKNKNLGVVISGTTGAGKTLAYAVPLLSTLSEALFLRQRLRISDEEAVGDTAGDLADRITVVTSPTVSSSSSSRGTSSKTPIAIGASLGRSSKNVRSPLALIVLPSRELGVQTAKLLYRLVGGSFREDDEAAKTTTTSTTTTPEDSIDAPKPPKYKGPKGVKIGTVLDDEDATMGLKLQTDIAITTPKYLSKLMRDGDIVPDILRVIAFDEADLSLEQLPTDQLEGGEGNVLGQLFAERTTTTTTTTTSRSNNDDNDIRLTFLVGASVTESLGNYAVSSKILPEGTSYIATATSCAPLTRASATATTPSTAGSSATTAASSREVATFQDLNVCLYPYLQHERVIVPAGLTALLVLTRLLRNELRAYDEGEGGDETAAAVDPPNQPRQRPRVVVFFPDEKTAQAAISPLRDALWGEHRLCVLLPTEGVMPLTIMEQFKRNETTVMLATPNSVRGLDFPALTHVYTTYCPADDPREYLHLAGRVGRIGHTSRGRVISVLTEAVAPQLDILAATLGFTFQDVEAPKEPFDYVIREGIDEEGEETMLVDCTGTKGGDVEKLRRFLEDTYALMANDEEEDLPQQPSSLSNDDDDGDMMTELQ
jgi:superfamily II DNA/RNA helicase